MYEEEGALIELMMCAVRQAAQATPPVGRTQGKKMVTHTDKYVHNPLYFMFNGTVELGGERNVSLFFLLDIYLIKSVLK